MAEDRSHRQPRAARRSPPSHLERPPRGPQRAQVMGSPHRHLRSFPQQNKNNGLILNQHKKDDHV